MATFVHYYFRTSSLFFKNIRATSFRILLATWAQLFHRYFHMLIGISLWSPHMCGKFSRCPFLAAYFWSCVPISIFQSIENFPAISHNISSQFFLDAHTREAEGSGTPNSDCKTPEYINSFQAHEFHLALFHCPTTPSEMEASSIPPKINPAAAFPANFSQ